jgi:hypothetical protein
MSDRDEETIDKLFVLWLLLTEMSCRDIGMSRNVDTRERGPRRLQVKPYESDSFMHPLSHLVCQSAASPLGALALPLCRDGVVLGETALEPL